MKNFVQPGDTIKIVSTGVVAAGALVLQGSLAGVAINGATGAGQEVELALTGVYRLPKTSAQAWTVGAPIYWTGTECTTTASTNKMIGTAYAVADNPSATGLVRLNGGAVTA